MFSCIFGRVPTIIRNPHFWLIVAMFAIGIVLHYPEQILNTSSPSLFAFLGLTRHAVERIYFLLPISCAGFFFGIKAGLASLAVALIIMLPRVFLSLSLYPSDALLETGGVIVIGGLVNFWFEGYKREKEDRQQMLSNLEEAQQELQSHIQVIKINEGRLATLNEVAAIISQSLELEDVLNAAADKVKEVMGLEVVLIFLLDEVNEQLELKTHRGISKEFAVGLKGLKVGEGLNGQVAQTGKPLLIDNAAQDPRLTREIVKQEGVQSALIVPLKAKGKVVGTASVAGYGSRQFLDEEVEMLTTIGNQIGIAIDNARLYEKTQLMANTEKQMRENLRFYLQQVTRAQEEERRRIARELHDDTTQNLVALSRRLDSLISTSDYLSPKDVTRLEELRQETDRISDGVHRFSQDLRPSILDDLGLLPALEWLTSDISKHFGIAIGVAVLGSLRRPSPEIELVLFRIAQESLRNMWKHSEASRAWVTVEFGSDKINLTVQDNGKGFKLPEKIEGLASTGKLGLAGMQERAHLIGGTLTLQSKPGEGTTVMVEIPV
jgi:signal transduction histidine kinase